MKFSFLFILLTLLFGQNVKCQKYTFDKDPIWIKPVEIPKNSTFEKHDIASGYYFTLVNYQVNLNEDAYYNREVINITSYSGITNASQLLITYDTSYQKLKIHHLFIWRKGEKLDRTKDLSFEIMNNEYSLQKGIYMGQITAYDNLNDIRKDDLIDFSYTLIGSNPIFDKEKYLNLPIESTNPLDLYSIRILYSKDKNYTCKCVDCDSVEYVNNIEDNNNVILINAKNVKPSKYEDNMPSWITPYKYFTLSSLKTWNDVNIWAQKVFALKQEPKLDIVFKEIFKGSETLDEKIDKIIDFVQDDIRYMGIESGIGSIKPFPPDQVVKQRFGDCKDKSLLLVSLLKKIGIKDAHLVLVNTNMQHELVKQLPSNEIFNHCIVTFNHNDSTYWVDPTIIQQGGNYKNLANYDYGKVLIIGGPSDSLPTMKIQSNKSGINIVDELTLKSFTDPGRLLIKSNRFGLEADSRRSLLDHYTSKDITKSVADELKLIYPTINSIDDLKVDDDIINNNVMTTYNYEIDGFWQDGDKKSDINNNTAGYWMFKFEPQTLYQYLSVSACVERKYDYLIDYPLNFEYKVIFNCPKEMIVYDKYKKIDNVAFTFEESIEQLSRTSFQIIYTYTTKVKSINTKDFVKVCEEKNKISKSLPLVIYFKK